MIAKVYEAILLYLAIHYPEYAFNDFKVEDETITLTLIKGSIVEFIDVTYNIKTNEIKEIEC